ncbi:MAG: alkaline phosphatase D family protein [Rhodanobacteraceae bacterium]|nr:alkaline phosphatase D family protein [Rhodanobacteraceae bacterium]
MMKIAFTSCVDALDDSEQNVWGRVAATEPDVLFLLGDTVYMDYGIFGERRLGWPRKASDEEFANTLYDRYRTQWSVMSFRALLSRVKHVALTWDDHDFAWNDSRGASTEKRRAVSPEKRQISRRLFEQFRQVLTSGAAAYPPIPSLAQLLEGPYVGIQSVVDIGNVRVVALDGRSFREDPNDVPDAEMHGRAQRTWLAQQLTGWQGIVVIGSGSVMSEGKESWDRYIDYGWLLQKARRPTIVLTGDIHRNATPAQHADLVWEVTSSGAARPGIIGGVTGNFGVLTVGDNVQASLYSRADPDGKHFKLEF